MGLYEYFDQRARRFGILDTKLAQSKAIFFTLIIVKLIPQIMEVNIMWFVLLAVLCAIKPVITGHLDIHPFDAQLLRPKPQEHRPGWNR